MISFLPVYGLLLMVGIVQKAIMLTPLSDAVILLALVKSVMIMLTVYALWVPVCCGLIFRLRAGNGLITTILAGILYYPIFSLATFIVVALAATDFLSTKISLFQLREWGLFPLGLGLLGCVLIIFMYHLGEESDLTVASSKHTYVPFEIGASVLSALAICALFLM